MTLKIFGWVELLALVVIGCLMALVFGLPTELKPDATTVVGALLAVLSAVIASRRWSQGQRGKYSYGQTTVEFDGQNQTVSVTPSQGAAPIQVVGPPVPTNPPPGPGPGPIPPAPPAGPFAPSPPTTPGA